MGFFKELQKQTDLERKALFNVPVISQCLKGQVTKKNYIAFLTEAYHHVKHTVPLLMACGSRLPEEYEWLREAVAEYIEEEKGHQEWILNDIEACGIDKEDIRRGRPLLATELMIAYVYDVINRGNPIGFFGMVQVLEGTSIALATKAAESIQNALELPDKAFSYLNSHGNLDIKHMEFFENLMNRITSEKDQEAILNCAKVIYKLYADIFHTLSAIPGKQSIA